MTTADVLVTLSVDDLLPGDEIRLVGRCTVLSVIQLSGARRVVYVRPIHAHHSEIQVWLWRHSRIEVLSDVSDRGALAISQHAVSSEATEEVKA